MACVIDKIASGHPQSRIDELVPRRWLELKQAEEQAGSDAAG